MKPREEIYHLQNGTGRIEVRGNVTEGSYGNRYGLFVDGVPFVYHWPECDGSIGQALCHFAHKTSDHRGMDLREIVSHVPSASSLAHQILSLLQQFPSGTYTLRFAPWRVSAPIDYWTEWSLEQNQTWYYPDDGVGFVPTLPEEALDEAQVLEWMYRIEQGARPFAITAGIQGGRIEFVLDGHHKLYAYALCGIPAWLLSIDAHSVSPLRWEDWPSETPKPGSWYTTHEVGGDNQWLPPFKAPHKSNDAPN